MIGYMRNYAIKYKRFRTLCATLHAGARWAVDQGEFVALFLLVGSLRERVGAHALQPRRNSMEPSDWGSRSHRLRSGGGSKDFPK